MSSRIRSRSLCSRLSRQGFLCSWCGLGAVLLFVMAYPPVAETSSEEIPVLFSTTSQEHTPFTFLQESGQNPSALLATATGGTTTYHHADHLSVRLTTDTSGNSLGQQGHYPFGEQWYPTPPPAPASKWQFTSYERDSESNNDHAMARYDINRLGRFSSPDLIAGSISNPQSLNRYAYVVNDPCNLTDPLGLQPGCSFNSLLKNLIRNHFSASFCDFRSV